MENLPYVSRGAVARYSKKAGQRPARAESWAMQADPASVIN
jgi:hypothetical protein